MALFYYICSFSGLRNVVLGCKMPSYVYGCSLFYELIRMDKKKWMLPKGYQGKVLEMQSLLLIEMYKGDNLNVENL